MLIPPDAHRFLQKVKASCRKICGEKLISIRVFGSLLDGAYIPGVSDIDFMVLVSNDSPKIMIEALRAELVSLEFVCNVVDVQTVGTLQRAFASRTAFFRSHFVFRISTIQSFDYSALVKEAEAFEVPGGRILQRMLGIFVPWRLVFYNVISQSRIVEGGDSLDYLRFSVPWRLEAKRNFLMGLGVTLLGALLSVFSGDGTRISLEGLKWYFIGEGTCLSKKRLNLSTAVSMISGVGHTDTFLERFLARRREYSTDRFFSIGCPLYLTYLHLVRSRLLWKRTIEFPSSQTCLKIT